MCVKQSMFKTKSCDVQEAIINNKVSITTHFKGFTGNIAENYMK